MASADNLATRPKTGREPQTEEAFSGVSLSGLFYVACSEVAFTPTNLESGARQDLFMHNNLANLINPTDMNCSSAMQYAVENLRFENIVICGHYGCKGVTTAIEGCRLDFLGNWLLPVVRIADKYKYLLDAVVDESDRLDRLCRLNVIEQVMNACRTSVVQEAWLRGQKLTVSGIIYDHKKNAFFHAHRPVGSNASVDQAYDQSLLDLVNHDDLSPHFSAYEIG